VEWGWGDCVRGFRAGTATDSCVGRDSVAGDAGEQGSRETYHYFPQFLPGGKQFLYLVRHGEAEKMGIYIGSLNGKPGTPLDHRIVQTEFKAEYDAGSGRLLYLQEAGVLMAQRLELDPPRLTGDPAMVRKGFATPSTTATRSFRFPGTARCFT
jgi:hypothetical protein